MQQSHRIEADLLIPGRGEPLHGACVILDGGKIGWVGPQNDAPSTAERMPTHRVPTVMPGLWDCHTHLAGLRTTSLDITHVWKDGRLEKRGCRERYEPIPMG